MFEKYCNFVNIIVFSPNGKMLILALIDKIIQF